MKISILMPVFNEEAYLQDAVESVAKQITDFDFELIIVDDRSTDNTSLIMRDLATEHSFVKCYENPRKGKNRAFNFAYEKSEGDLIVLFAGDDILPVDSLQMRATPLLEFLGARAVSFCKLAMFSEIKKFDGVVTPKHPEKGAMIGGSIMMTRSMADSCFPLPEYLGNEDLWVMCHVSHLPDINVFHVPKVGIKYRIHENNSSTRTERFKLKNEAMHVRFIVYSVFLERYREQLSEASVDVLSAQAAAETLRYNGDSLAILLMRGLGLSNRARFFMHSGSFLYWVRIRLFALLSGR